MIQIERLIIREFRGIRDLRLNLDRRNFVVHGPNGSGKSGVVDAIQFALTGEIGRLKGAGTGGLSLTEHGPHVELRKDPGKAVVELEAFIPHLNRRATIRRSVAQAKEPYIVPDDEEIRGIFAEVSTRPEITLARREIIRLILTEATKRSQDVQTLLQLDRVDEIRGVLKTTENRLGEALIARREDVRVALGALTTHLGIAKGTGPEILGAVNQRRRTLSLPDLKTLTALTHVSEGLGAAKPDGLAMAKDKATALRRVDSLRSALGGELERSTRMVVESLTEDFVALETHPELQSLLAKRSLLEAGLAMIGDGDCPLCDTRWDVDALREHLQSKLAKAESAASLSGRLVSGGRVIASATRDLLARLQAALELRDVPPDVLEPLEAWADDLRALEAGMKSADSIVALRDRLQQGWMAMPERLDAKVEQWRATIQEWPEHDSASAATVYLAVADERLSDLRKARGALEVATVAADRARVAYKAYLDTSEEVLHTLYKEVEADFNALYRVLNEDDESEFTAELEPSRGKLGLRVDFYKKGMFPPGAYHSEGHQDGMGVCLYLALLKRVFGAQLRLVVLDDVVMSVDAQHRKRFCKLLKAHFADTQFVITTHDEVWARQMRSQGLVSSKGVLTFHGWSIESGPVAAEVADIWEQLEQDLKTGDVAGAAAKLRRHMEYVARELAHALAARVPFRADGAYDLGQLLSAVIGQHGDLLGRAASAAASWKQESAAETVKDLQSKRSEALKAVGAEEWAVNKLVHFNEWAVLTPDEFRQVLDAFKALLGQLACPKCGAWLYVTPALEATDLRCDCGEMRLNLRRK